MGAGPDRGDELTRILILGGGIGGQTVARRLTRRLGPAMRHRLQIVLADAAPSGAVRPLLPRVASGSLPAASAAVEFERSIPRVRTVRLLVSEVDTADRIVRGTDPVTGHAEELGYDHLVVALGGTNEDLGVEGVRENAVCLRTPSDALEILRHIGPTHRHASPRPDHPLVVVGAGVAGIALAGPLARKRPDLSVLLLDRRPRLLTAFESRVGEAVVDSLEHAGVHWMPESTVTRIRQGSITLRNGSEIPSSMTVWAAGLRAVPVVETSFDDAEHTSGGRLVTDPMLRVRGVDDVWACGDSASVPWLDVGGDCPRLGTFARAQARRLASNLEAALTGEYPRSFRYDAGVAVPLGPGTGVALVRGRLLTGRSGLLAWAAALALAPRAALATRANPGDLVDEATVVLATRPEGTNPVSLGPTRRGR